MSSLPFYTVLDARLERLPKPELRRMQAERLRTMVRYVYDNTGFWRAKLDAAGLSPDDVRGLEDLPSLPTCTKPELQADQEAHPPFGSYVATDRTHWAKFLSTSGTTGRPLKRVFSRRDWEYVLDKFQRRRVTGPGEISVVLGPTDGLMGPSASIDSAARMGAMVVPAGRFDTKDKIALIRELRPTSVSGTASYLLHLAEVARGMGVDLAQCGISSITSVGEPGAAIAATRRRLAEAWGVQAIGDGYGMTEIMPLGGSCPFSTSLHIPDDLVITEVIDAETGAPLPPGEPGELVYTNLIGDTQPLLRYRSRDVGRISDDEPCQCGFTGTRIVGSIEGRVDDMIWYRGANLFPSAIEAVVHSFAELSDEFQIVLDQQGTLQTLTVRAEHLAEAEGAADADLRERLAAALQAAIRVHAEVELAPAGMLPRPDPRAKARRVVDRRD